MKSILVLVLLVAAATAAPCCSGGFASGGHCVDVSVDLCERIDGVVVEGDECGPDQDGNGIADVCDATCGDATLDPWEACDGNRPDCDENCALPLGACCSYTGGGALASCEEPVTAEECEPTFEIPRFYLPGGNCSESSVCPESPPASAICMLGDQCCQCGLDYLWVSLIGIGVGLLVGLACGTGFLVLARVREEDEKKEK